MVLSDHDRRAVLVAEMVRMSGLHLAYIMPNASAELLAAADELGEAWATMADGDAKVADFLDTLAGDNDDEDEMPPPCQPIGCDNGYHLCGCPYASADDDEDPYDRKRRESFG
jgi:hypothetical protein